MYVWIVSLFAWGEYIILVHFSTSGEKFFVLCVHGLEVKACARELMKWL